LGGKKFDRGAGFVYNCFCPVFALEASGFFVGGFGAITPHEYRGTQMPESGWVAVRDSDVIMARLWPQIAEQNHLELILVGREVPNGQLYCEAS
jgi:hypothetical protein